MSDNIIDTVVWGNSLRVYFISILVFILAVAAVKVFRHVILRWCTKKAAATAVTIDDFLVKVINKAVSPALYFGAFYTALKIPAVSSVFQGVMDRTGMIVIIFCAGRFTAELVSYGFSLYWSKQGRNVASDRSLEGILNVLVFIVWAFALIFALDNLGFRISTVIAGLGIGGVAVALAAQAVLKDLFSYFSMLFDRPFETGDFIIVGEYMGTVEHIGIKTTRVRSLGGEQIIFSNSDLTDSRVRNYKRMEKRRVVFSFGVTYQTPLEKMRTIPDTVRKTVHSVPGTVFDRAHFASYGDSSLVFEAVYYVLSSDYNKYMDIHQAINFALKEEFEKQKIEFAYPTQTVYVNKIT